MAVTQNDVDIFPSNASHHSTHTHICTYINTVNNKIFIYVWNEQKVSVLKMYGSQPPCIIRYKKRYKKGM